MRDFSEGMSLVVSLACLLQYGTCLREELPRRALQHSAFRQYESRKISRSEAVAAIQKKYHITKDAVEELLFSLADSCSIDEELMSALLKSGRRLVGWIDIPGDEWELVQPKFSALRQHFAELIHGLEGLPKAHVLIIDRDIERASVRNCQGWSAIAFTDGTREGCFRVLRRLQLPKAIQMGKEALKRAMEASGARSRVCFESGKELYMTEYFAPALISMVTSSDALHSTCGEVISLLVDASDLVKHQKPFGFNGMDFRSYPADIDTMSSCASVLLDLNFITAEEANITLDMVLSNVDNEEGLLMVYFDPSRPRVDLVATVNALYLAYLLQRESHPAVRHHEAMVQSFLLTSGYKWGTKYYPQDSFLFHYGRLLSRFGGARIPNYEKVLQATKNGIINGMGWASKSPFDIAKRLLVSSMLGIHNEVDKDILLQAQNKDGTWPLSEVYVLPNSQARMYNEVVELCFILAALKQEVLGL